MTELRYGFGKNWEEFVQKNLSDEIVADSVAHMARFMRVDSLKGRTFLDIGCGSGIHSLAALRLGADKVVSFDYDHDSVATTQRVKEWAGEGGDWTIMQGSVLDAAFMRSLPKADIVYSWGVLHHTGAMWEAVKNASMPLAKGGDFYIALYSSDNYIDPTPAFWIRLKRAYNQADALTRKLMEIKYVHWILIRPEIEAGRDALGQMKNYGKRGMTAWTDAKDWLGGYPMEFASYGETRDYCKGELDLDLVNVLTGEGCTEYLFARIAEGGRWRDVERGREVLPFAGPFQSAGGAAYAFELPATFDGASDAEADRMASRVMMFEDGKPLGLAHCLHDHIRKHGRGRFSHWGRSVIFSASDNSDPNSNGRRYGYCERY